MYEYSTIVYYDNMKHKFMCWPIFISHKHHIFTGPNGNLLKIGHSTWTGANNVLYYYPATLQYSRVKCPGFSCNLKIKSINLEKKSIDSNHEICMDYIYIKDEGQNSYYQVCESDTTLEEQGHDFDGTLTIIFRSGYSVENTGFSIDITKKMSASKASKANSCIQGRELSARVKADYTNYKQAIQKDHGVYRDDGNHWDDSKVNKKNN